MRPYFFTFLVCLFTASSVMAGGGVDKSGLKPQVLKLPSGPGSIQGMGESFEPQLNSGTAAYRVPISLPPGRAGFTPALALVYNGGKGNSSLGIGWQLSLSYIQRQTDKGLPVYNDAKDTFVNDQGEELVLLANGTYRCENETTFDLFERLGDEWAVSHKDGSKSYYGLYESARIQDGTNIFKWYISKQVDTNGNEIFYSYNEKPAFTNGVVPADRQVYLTSITYNQGLTQDPSMRVELNYETRLPTDSLFDYRPRFPVQTTQRCREIIVKAGGNRVRSYQLNYDTQSFLSRLHKVEMYGENEALGPLETTLTFEYTEFALNSTLTPMNTGMKPDVGLSSSDADLADMNGDGFPDLIYTGDEHEVYLNNDGRKWLAPYIVAGGFSGYKLSNPNTMLMDMNGDGYSDLFVQDKGVDGYSYFTGGQQNNGWYPYPVEMEKSPQFTFGQYTKPVDLDNNGMTDVLWKGNMSDDMGCVFNLNGKKMSGVFSIPAPSVRVEFNFGAEGNSGLILADMNGDGLQDFVILNGEDQIWYYPGHGVTLDAETPWKYQGWDNTPRGAWIEGDRSAEGLRMANAPNSNDESDFTEVANYRKLKVLDINGDGLSDLVYVANNRIKAWLNLGGSAFSPTPYVVDKNIPALGDVAIRTVDMNANGTIDVVWNRQAGFSEVGYDDVTWVYLDLTAGVRPNLLRSIDNGIGQVTTIEYKSSTAYLVADRNNKSEWKYKLPTPVTVVSKISVFDGRNSSYTREMTYHDGYYDGKEKEFRGFEKAEQREVGDATAPDLIMAYTYNTGAATEALKGKPLAVKAMDASQGVFYQENNMWETKVLAGGVQGDTRQVTFPFQKERTRDVRERGTDTVQLKWEYVYDDYGNMTRQVDHGRVDGNWDDERVTETTYTAQYPSGLSKWILDQAVESVTKDETGAISARKRNYYDGLGLGEVSKGNLTKVEDWVSGDMFVTSVRNDYDDYGNIVAMYDPLYGKEPGHYRQMAYDSTYHTFPVEEKIYTGTTTLAMSATYYQGWGVMKSSTDYNGYTTTYGYDTFGRLVSITKPPDAGHTVEYGYTLAYKLGTGTSKTTINWVETRQRDGSAGDGFLHSRTFYDGMGRKIMTRSEGEDAGQVVVTDTVQFNARKLLGKKYLPYFEGGSLDFVEPTFNTGFTEHFYDALGREIRVNQPVGQEGIVYAETTYTPLQKTVRDEEQTKSGSIHAGNNMRYVTDGLLDKDGNGRLREVYEVVKLSDTGAYLETPVAWKTTYFYDLLDNLTGYVDAQNNRKAMSYDGLKRRVSMKDPDRGDMAYTYDDAGNLIKTVDAKGQVIRYKYDGVNRLTAEYYGAGTTTPDVEYHYDLPGEPVGRGEFWGETLPKAIAGVVLNGGDFKDDYDLNKDGKLDVSDVVKAARASNQAETIAAENTKGFLSWVRDQSGKEQNSYDARGRVKWVVKGMYGNNQNTTRNFYTGMDYDSMDRITSLFYPDSTCVKYNYNSRGLLESAPNVIDRYDYNPSGQNKELALACGTITKYDYDHRLRLSRLSTSRNRDGLVLQDFVYTYDGISNITKIADGRDNATLDKMGAELGVGAVDARKFNATQSFLYDALYRLTQASNAAVYGKIDHRYDRIGNMIRQDAALLIPDLLMNLGEMKSGGVAGAWNRTSKKSKEPGPHAITYTEKGPKGALAFTYDDNGNMMNDRDSDLTWDYKDRLTSIANGTATAQYVYDYTGTRKKKVAHDIKNNTESEALYIDKLSEVRDGKLVKYVYAGSNRVARSEGEQGVSSAIQPSAFYLHDHLGSTNLTITTDATVSEQMVNYPFGHQRYEKRSNTSVKLADYKFTGKETDEESGLQYFEARYLGGYLGRFLSVDTIDEYEKLEWLFKPQALNCFTYCENKPTKCIDGTGKSAFLTGGLVGGAVGAVVAAATETIHQVANSMSTGEGINTKNISAAAAEGLVSGAITGASIGLVADGIVTGGASAPVELTIIGGLSGAFGGGMGKVAGNHIRGDKLNKEVGTAMKAGAISGAIQGVGVLAQKVLAKIIGTGGSGEINSGGGLLMKTIDGKAAGQINNYVAPKLSKGVNSLVNVSSEKMSARTKTIATEHGQQ